MNRRYVRRTAAPLLHCRGEAGRARRRRRSSSPPRRARAVARAIEYRGAAKPGVSVLGIDVGGQVAGRGRGGVRAAGARRAGHDPRRRPRLPRSARLARLAQRRRPRRARSTPARRVALVVPLDDHVRPVLAQRRRAGDVLRAARARRAARRCRPRSRCTGPRSSRRRRATGCELDRGGAARPARGGLDACRRAVPSAARWRSGTRGAQRRFDGGLLLAHRSSSTTTARASARSDVQLARALRVSPQSTVRGRIRPDRLARVVRPRLGRWFVRAHNAQFAVAGNRVRVVPSDPAATSMRAGRRRP